MKNILLKAAVTTVFAIVAGYCVYISKQETQMSDIAMENVEALANGEESGEKAYCWTQFSGGIAWPRQCPSCVRLPFATGIGATGICTVN
ncbi:MAG: NVEALA domain-containing protein [Bacteroidales bacterium]|nr:NVEALA domain-containing protein [Bacteroidales bacterium]